MPAAFRIKALGRIFEAIPGGIATFKLSGEHNIYEAMARQKRKVLAGDQAAIQRMLGAWKVAEKGIQTRLDAVTAKIAATKAAGLDISPAWLYQQDRWHEFVKEIQAQIDLYSKDAATIALALQKNGFQQGSIDAKQLVAAAGVSTGFKQLPAKAFERMVGILTDKSPLHDLFKQLGPDAVSKARQIFAVGTAAGDNPNVIAKRFQDELAMTKQRSVLIARTESHRAYVTAQRDNYAANSDVVIASRWVSARDGRTCALCWAKDGEIIDFDDPLGFHPGCRCALAPVVKYLDTPRQTGEEVLAEREQKEPGYAEKVLGPSRYDLWKSGEIALTDLVDDVNHPRWGRGIRAKTLKQIESDINAGLAGKPLPKITGHVAGSIPIPKADLLADNPKFAPVAFPSLPPNKNLYIEAMVQDMANGGAHMTPTELEDAANKLYPKAKPWDPVKHILPKYLKAGVDPNPATPIQAAAPVAPVPTSPLQDLLDKSAKPTNLKHPTGYTKMLLKKSGADMTPSEAIQVIQHYFPNTNPTVDSILYHYASVGVTPKGGFPPGFQFQPKTKAAPKAAPAQIAQPQAAPSPSAASVILDKQVGPQAGSNPGGVYLGSDGVQRYVKFYDKADQPYGEHLANQIYRLLGIEAPNSTLFTSFDGRLAYASELMPVEGTVGSKGLTKPIAREILSGFAADILTANWDAVGLSLDNVVILKGGGIARIDNGGTFLYRATNGLKPDHLLQDISEWYGFAPGGKNTQYASVFTKAGYSSPEELGKGIVTQIKAIADLEKTVGGWEAFVRANTPGLDPILQKKIADMLTARTGLLKVKAQEIQAQLSKPKPVKGATGANGFKETTTSVAADTFRRDLAKTGHRGITGAAKAALTAYKGFSYAPMNQEMRGLRPPMKSITDKIDALAGAFASKGGKMPEDSMLFRGIPDASRTAEKWHLFTKADIGRVISDQAFLSAATLETFSMDSWIGGGKQDAVLLRMRVPEGTKYVNPRRAKESDSEFEVMFHGGAWRVIDVYKKVNRGGSDVTVLEVEMVGSQEGTKNMVNRWKM